MKENLFTFVPSLLSVAIANAMVNNNLEEKIFLLHDYSTMSQSLLSGYQDKKVKLELETNIMEECSCWLTLWLPLCLFPALCSACFLINPELPCLDIILSTKLNTNITQN